MECEEPKYKFLSRVLPVMTIKRINIDYLEWHYRQAEYTSTGNQPTNPTLEDLANYAVEKYNQTSFRKSPPVVTEAAVESDGEESEEYSESSNPVKGVFKPVTMSEEWRKQATANSFSLLGFYCHVSINRTIESLLEEAGNGSKKPQDISYIFVFYRGSGDRRCMYTLTCGMRGYVPFQKFSDYHFPRKIAVRLLDPDKISVAESKQVIGPIIWSRVICRGSLLYDPSDAFKVFMSFKAPLKTNASIFSLPQFKYNVDENGRPKEFTEFEIKLGGIRIGKLMPFTAYSHILNHFEIISNGGKTYEHSTGEEKKEETDSEASFRHLFYFSYVKDRMTINKLNQCLVDQLVKCFTEEGNHGTWDVCHPKLDDYYKSSAFCLKYRYRNLKYDQEIPNRLSFDELREEVTNCTGYVHCYKSALHKVLQDVQLGFRFGGDWVLAPILDCLMGQLDVTEQNGEAKTYYKMSKSWYEVDQHLLKTIDREFQQCMKACMLFDNQEGFLPRPWKSSKPKLREISKQLSISAADIRALCKRTFSYVNETDGDKVMCSVLAGEILLNLDVQKYAKGIEELLTKSRLKREDLNKILKPGDKSCVNSIWRELVKERTVGEIDAQTTRVLITSPYYPYDTDKKTREILVELANRSIWTKTEGEYNEGYLFTQRKETDAEQPKPYTLDDGSGYLLGDRICPQGIELFDILYFTPEKTYLYHVKDGFNQNTRAACSQIRNSAILLANALQNQSSILDEFFDAVVKPDSAATEYRKLAKQQMEAFGKDSFKKLFQKDQKNIVLVYAFLDDRADAYCEVTSEMVEKDYFAPRDFAMDDSDHIGQLVFDELVAEGYLDKEGRRDKKFFTVSKESQLLFQNKDLLKYKSKALKILNGGLGSFGSFIARLEVLHTRVQVTNKGFDFKICQIKQPRKQSRLPNCRPGVFAVRSDQQPLTKYVYYRNEGDTPAIIGFHVPKHPRVSKSYSAFRAVFGESCGNENDEREKFVDLLRVHIEEQDVLKLLKDNTKLLVLGAAWRKDDSSKLGMEIKHKESLLLSYDENGSRTVERLRSTARDIKLHSNELLKIVFENKALFKYIRKELGIDKKTTEYAEAWFRTYFTWFIKILCALGKDESQLLACNASKLKGDFQKLGRYLRDMDGYVNELCNQQSFRDRIFSYFQKEYPFTSHELELLAYVNKLRVEIIRLGSNSGMYDCVNGQIFHKDKELIVVRDTGMLYERCELDDTPGAFKPTAVIQID